MDIPVLHRNRTVIYLPERQGFDAPILIKEPATGRPDPATISELHNEYAVATRLADVCGVRRVLAKEGSESHPSLVQEYIEGCTLAEVASTQSLSLADKLRFSVDLAETLAQIHRRQISHRAISGQNILVGKDRLLVGQSRLYLIDFGAATALQPEMRQRLAADYARSDDLAYISPEQTGRMNRLVDYRTDLYSLGIVLYELFTGVRPFQTDNILEMIHCHIARHPIAPHEVTADIPLPLSQIILKLLQKNAEDRYQTASGLQADLSKCLDRWQSTGQVDPFELGFDDFTGRLRIPRKLYGRQDDIDQLLTSLDRVAHGRAELVLVAGYAGVGKTALVHEIDRPLAERQGLFIEGKFDQYQRNTPYLAWTQAFCELVDSWLSESNDRVVQRQTAILKAVGRNGRVLVEAIPKLELIIGPQPSVQNLGGAEAENRFNYLFRRFVEAVATPDQPLAIFLDDVQWIDPASFNLLKALLTDVDIKQFLIIAAYRHNEVTSGNPLMLGISDLESANVAVNQISLDELTDEETVSLLSDSLTASKDRCRPLARLIHNKTGGNAFFTRQFLYTLENEGQLFFDAESTDWQWDMAVLQQLSVSDNVIDMLVDSLNQLPDVTRELLQTAACIGVQFEPELAGSISGLPLEATQNALAPAFQAGFLIAGEGFARFVHDRVHEATYALVGKVAKAEMHYRIGQALLVNGSGLDQSGRIFDIVGHLNEAISLIETETERAELATLNLEAAQSAMAATAYAAALSYAKAGKDLLLEKGWQSHYSLTLELYNLTNEAAYLCVDVEASEATAAALLENARSLSDKIPVYAKRLHFYGVHNQVNEAITDGMAVLSELGFPLSESAPPDLDSKEFSKLPLMTDTHAAFAMEILTEQLVATFMVRPDLFPRVVFSVLQIMRKHGLHPASGVAVCMYGSMLWSDDIDSAYRFGELSLEIIDRLGAYRYLSQVKTAFDAFILPWKADLQSVEDQLRLDIQLGLESGSHVYVGTASSNATYAAFMAGRTLAPIQESAVKYLDMQQTNGRDLMHALSLWTQFLANLRQTTTDPSDFEGPYFSEERDLLTTVATGNTTTTYFFHLLKLIVHFHLNDPISAYSHSLKAEKLLPTMRSHMTLTLFVFYQSLAIVHLPERDRDQVVKFEANIARLRDWARHVAQNLEHKLELLLAEQARLDQKNGEAIDHYEAAIVAARKGEFLQDEALANELYGRFWHARGNEPIARHYLSEAHALYGRWGAVAFVQHLESQFPAWLKSHATESAHAPSMISAGQPQLSLDVQSILKASQTIAGEIEMERVLAAMMNIAMENAGAQRGFLVMESDDGHWVIEAGAEVGQSQPTLAQSLPIAGSNLLSEGIVRYVARTQETVVLENATHTGEFVRDPHVQHNQVQSILCMPLIEQGDTSGILYLENNLATNVFTKDKVALLDTLAGQMAISLNNARLVEQLGKLLAQRTTALKSAESQIRTLFESTPLGVTLGNTDGQFLAVNPALLQMTGYSETEILELNAVSLYHEPEQRSEFLKRLADSDRVRDFGLRIVRKDGTSFFASLNANRLISSQEPDNILVVIEDVTAKVLIEQALQESNRNLVNLLDSARTMTVALDLDDLLKVIFTQLSRLTTYLGAVIWLREDDDFFVLASQADEGMGSLAEESLALDDLISTAEMMATRQPIRADDAALMAHLFRNVVVDTVTPKPEPLPTQAALLAIPLIAKDRLIGVLGLLCGDPETYNKKTTELMQAFANQAATAIENARLHQQVQHVAVMEERDRLARELHDAVTQTLFSASVIAETAPIMWEKDHTTAIQYLEPLPVMLRGALAEMRALLLELRPDALREQSMGQLLSLLADSARAQTRATVTVKVEGERLLPEDVTLNLYRIVQESLNNVAKHAEAQRVNIWLIYSSVGVELHISDDGRGFEPSTVGHSHLGLGIMKDRAQQIGATFEVSSSPKEGTVIFVSWPDSTALPQQVSHSKDVPNE